MLAALSAASALLSPAWAATIHWSNASGGDWNVGANWGGSVPGSGDDAVIDFAGTYTVTLSAGASVQSLVVGGAAGVQTLQVNGVALTTTNGTSIVVSGALELWNGAALAGGLDNGGTFVARGIGAGNAPNVVTGALVTHPGSKILIDPGVVGNHSYLATPGFTNEGVIELDNHAPNHGLECRLTTAGTLINNGELRSLASVGYQGPRTLAAELSNAGMVAVSWPLTIVKAGAAHTSSGSFVVNQTLTVDLTSGGSFTQSGGSIAVGASQTMEVRGGTATAAGTTSGAGTIAYTNGCTVSGLVLTGTSAQTELWNASTAVGLDNGGTFVARGIGAGNAPNVVTGALVTHPGSKILIDPGVVGNHSYLATPGFTNEGVIELDNHAPNHGLECRLTTAGTLINNGELRSLASVGYQGPRTLAAELSNAGMVTVGWPLTIVKAGAAHTSSGSFVVNQTLTVDLTSGGSFTQSGGSIAVGASQTMEVRGGTATAAGTTSGAGTIAYTNGCTVSGLVLTGTSAQTELWNASTAVGLDNGGTFVARGIGAGNAPNVVTGALVTHPGSKILIDPGVVGNHSYLATPGFTNEGVIELDNHAPNHGLECRLTTAGTLINNGELRSLASVGYQGPRTLAAELSNAGMVTVSWPLTIVKTGAAHTSSGSFVVNQTLTVDLTSGGSFTQSGGSIAVGASQTMEVRGGTATAAGTTSGAGTIAYTNGCTVSGLVLTGTSAQTELWNASTAVGLDNGGTFVARGIGAGNAPNVVTGALVTHPGSKILIDPGVVGNHSYLATPGFTNEGVIELDNHAPNHGLECRLTTAGTLINNGELRSLASVGYQGPRTLAAELSNAGMVAVSWPLTIVKAGAAHTSSGSFVVNQTLTVDLTSGGSFTQSGGSIAVGASQTMEVRGGTATAAGTTSGAGTIAYTNGCTVSGLVLTGTSAQTELWNASTAVGLDNGGTFVARGIGAGNAPNVVTGALVTHPGSKILIDPGVVGNHSYLATPGFTNEGVIELDNHAPNHGLECRLTTAGTLINNGELRSLASVGYQGPRTLAAELSNAGMVTVGWPLKILVGPLTNASGGVIRGTSSLDVSSVVFNDNGTSIPGASPGTLSYVGNDTRSITSALQIEVGGTAVGSQFDRLDVSGTAGLEGTLSLALINGYVPAFGTRFAILRSATRTGTFRVVSGRSIPGNLEFQVDYLPNGVDLVVGAQGPNDPPVAAADSAVTGEDVAVDVELKTNDSDPNADAVYVLPNGFSAPSHGSVSLNVDETAHYVPAFNYFGPDSFTYTLDDGRGMSATGVVRIRVTPLNDPPAFEALTPGEGVHLVAVTGTHLAFTVTARDSDDAGAVTLSASGLPAGSSMTPPLPVAGNPATSTFDWTPVVADIGAHPVQFTAVDDSSSSATRHVVIDVVPPAAGCGQDHWVDGVTAGTDNPSTEADVGIDTYDDGNFDGQADLSFRLNGPVTVHHTGAMEVSSSHPGIGSVDSHLDVIDTEILSMHLTGGGYALRAGTGQGFPATTGVIQERDPDHSTANSFFDVLFVIDTPGGPLYNQQPLRVETIIDCVPPHAQYLHPMGGAIGLYTSPTPGQGTHVANLVDARHTVGAPPACDQPHWVDTAPSGTDSPSSEADVGLDLGDDGNFDGQVDRSFRLRGPVVVRRGAPREQSAYFPVGSNDSHLDVIDTEILSMHLEDQGVTLTVGAGLGQGGVLAASRGAIQEQSNHRLADSFFDVFFEVMTPAGPAYNQQPLRLSAIIDCVPPTSSYIHPDSVIALYSSPVPGQGTLVANLVTARHTVGPQPLCPGPHWVDSAPPGLDSPNSEADVGIDLDLDEQVDQSFRLRGPLTVRRTGALDASFNYPGQGSVDGHLDVIDTEILSMTLTDADYRLVVGGGLGAGGILAASKGTIVEMASDSTRADSFFDVFFEITLPDQTHVYNQQALHVQSQIDCVPPVGTYVHPQGIVPLYTSPIPGQGMHVANLVTAQHSVGGGGGNGVCTISGPDSSCIGFTSTYRVASNTSGAVHHWSVGGDGTIVGPSTLDSVQVMGVAAKSYTVSVTVSDAILSATCTKSVVVFNCETATLLSRFEGRSVDAGVELTWRFADPSQVVATVIERSVEGSERWTAIAAETRIEAGAVVAVDRNTEPGESYLYRLNTRFADGGTNVFGPIAVKTRLPVTEFALGALRPNPTSGEVRFEYTLAYEADVQLVVLDVLGREVATLASGRQTAGTHQATWNGQTRTGRAAAGLYMIRYRSPAKTLVRRLALVR